MNKLLQVHKYLICVCVLGLVLAVLLNLFLFAPVKEQLEELRQDVEGAESALRKMGMPADVASLNKLLAQASGMQAERQKQCDKLLERYEAAFLPAIQKNGWRDMGEFVRQKPQPTRDMYMREFERIIQNSPMGNLNASGARLGIELNSDSSDRYRLLLRLWGLETLIVQMVRHELTLANDELEIPKETTISRRHGNANSERNPSAKSPALAIASLAPVEMMQTIGKTTTLRMLKLEFLIGVTGPMERLAAFASELGRQDCGFGIEAFELTLQPPAPGAPAESDGTLRLNLKLVSFISLDTNKKKKD